MNTAADPHPPVTEIRRFAIHATKARASARIENHIAFCPRCAAALDKIQQQHQRVRIDLRNCGFSSHVSPEGPISIWVMEVDAVWRIHIVGPGINVKAASSDRATAVRTAIAEFTNALPQHGCEDCPPPRCPMP